MTDYNGKSFRYDIKITPLDTLIIEDTSTPDSFDTQPVLARNGRDSILG